MNWLRIVVAAGALALLSVGCSRGPGTGVHHEKVVKIGLSMDSFVVERWIRDRDIFVAEAQALGAQVLVQVANQDHETQVNQIRSMVDQGVDVLVVVPNDSTRLGPMIRQVRDRGIPVISYDRLILKGKCDLYIAHDNVAAGSLMGKAVAFEVAKKKRPRPFQLIVVNGARSDHNSILMNEGLHRILDPEVLLGRLAVVREIWLDEWTTEEAEKDFQAALEASGRRPDGVVGANDMVAESLIRVLSQHSWLDGTVVTGMDADLAACQRVVEGTQTMTVYKPIAPLAIAAARYAVKLAHHEALDITEFISDGEFQVPYVKLQPVAVTKANMMQVVVKDGFHRKEEVYREPENH